MKKYILASGSPRRKDLLRGMGIEFEVILPSDETEILHKSFNYELVERVAKEKGESVLKKAPENSIIISADTVVVCDNIILGKPRSFDDAFHILKLLNNNTHKVVTAVCIIDSDSGKELVRSETSSVTFDNISDEELKDYIYKFKPYDKAGSYGIQELKSSFIKNIEGEYENIVGLPIKLLKSMLNEIMQ